MVKYLENHSTETIFLFLFVIFNCDNLLETNVSDPLTILISA